MITFPFNDFTLSGKRALVTAGPTYEALDPVRFIGNHSTGKMGFAIAQVLADAGASVTLVSGPTHIMINHPLITRIDVVTAEEMYNASIVAFPSSDIAILAAAVADYKPAQYAKQKIKKSGDVITLKLTRTIDIARQLGKLKCDDQFLAGFALETENEKANAEKKLREKNLDFIVLNSLNDEGAGFGHNTNRISILYKNGNVKTFDLKNKLEVAYDIVEEVIAKSALFSLRHKVA